VSSLLSQLLSEAGLLDKKKFLAKYPHPWLISELIKLPQLTKAAPDPRVLTTDSMIQGNQRMMATKPSATALKTRTDSFLIFPIVKSDRNMWEDRVFVGRAANNDVVLEDPSVSKAHAYFILKGAHAQLVALQTLNATKIGTSALNPQGTSTPVPDGVALEFGGVGCRFFESASLHALLTGK
jgi:hypothetical protein